MEPELYKRYLLSELAPEFQGLLDVRKCGIGERLVFEPYTKEMFEQTHRWMVDRRIFVGDEVGTGSFESVVV